MGQISDSCYNYEDVKTVGLEHGIFQKALRFIQTINWRVGTNWEFGLEKRPLELNWALAIGGGNLGKRPLNQKKPNQVLITNNYKFKVGPRFFHQGLSGQGGPQEISLCNFSQRKIRTFRTGGIIRELYFYVAIWVNWRFFRKLGPISNVYRGKLYGF